MYSLGHADPHKAVTKRFERIENDELKMIAGVARYVDRLHARMLMWGQIKNAKTLALLYILLRNHAVDRKMTEGKFGKEKRSGNEELETSPAVSRILLLNNLYWNNLLERNIQNAIQKRFAIRSDLMATVGPLKRQRRDIPKVLTITKCNPSTITEQFESEHQVGGRCMY